MRPHRLLAGIATLSLPWAAAAVPGGRLAAQAPTLVLTGGRVFTADSARPWAEAVAIRGERIVAVGTNAQIERLASPTTRRLPLGGRLVVPGFNDAHAHLGCHAVNGVRVATSEDVFPDPPFAVVADSLRGLAARVPPGTWLATAIGDRVLGDPAARRRTLDQIAPRHPVLLRAWTGHGAILNTAGLRALAISDTAADPVGGRYEREPGSRRVSGLLEEYAGFAATRRQCSMSQESTLVAGLRAAAQELVRFGITSVQSMTNELEPALLMRVFRSAAVPLRVRLIATPFSTPAGRSAEWAGELAAGDTAVNDNGGTITVSGLKWILDGTPIERLQVERIAYRDRPGWHGRLDFPPDTIRALLLEARAAGQQPVLHAGGDSTIRVVLRALEETGGSSSWTPLRVRIEHGDDFPAAEFARARRLGITLVQNPTHLVAHPVFAERLEPAVLSSYQPLRSVLEAGIPVAIGSDGPMNPFLNILMATVYDRRPAEALTREQAVRAYTRGGAYAEGAEREKGTIAPGMLADLAVLSQDIFTVSAAELPRTVSLLTVLGGRIVFDGLNLVLKEQRASRK